jgi:hypothetical protein
VGCGRSVGSGWRLTSHGLAIASASKEGAVLVVKRHVRCRYGDVVIVCEGLVG